jgi:hypothetical protein
MVDNSKQDEESGKVVTDRGNNVVPFGPRYAATVPAPATQQEPFFTDAERREIREMLAYYRKARPEFEALKTGCPTARMLLDK